MVWAVSMVLVVESDAVRRCSIPGLEGELGSAAAALLLPVPPPGRVGRRPAMPVLFGGGGGCE